MNRPTRQSIASASLSLACLAVLLGGCDLDDLLDRFNDFDECATSSGNVQVAGEWEIVGEGSRTSCNDEKFNGDFSLSAEGIRVTQMNGQTDDDVLELGEAIDVPDGEFLFFGTVRGTCVDFTAEEDGVTGFFRFDFEGNLDGREIAGEFTGDGPPGCRSSGEFRARFE